MGAERTADLWWKHAVIYSLDVETFVDSDGDGHGDFDGLLSRIDHLSALGVSCLWLLPFFPTPNRDDGYDIADFDAVDRRLGTLGQFVELVRTARDRGMRVIVDLVLNHTSDQHPWFQAALDDPNSKYRDFYVWSDEPRDDLFDMVIFPDEETSNWELHEATGQYYLHRFYAHQPDINVANPEVRDAFAEIVGFWLQVGDDGDQLNVLFSFDVNQAMWLSLARQDARRWPQRSPTCPRSPTRCTGPTSPASTTRRTSAG